VRIKNRDVVDLPASTIHALKKLNIYTLELKIMSLPVNQCPRYMH
jgi:hypothetical protein